MQHFVTYANLQSHLRRNVLLGSLLGPVGIAVAGSFHYPYSEVLTTPIDSTLLEGTSGGQEHTRAYFSLEENPSKAPVNMIYIDAAFLGKRVASRCLVPPVAGKPHLLLIEALDMCIANHLALHRNSLTAAKADRGAG